MPLMFNATVLNGMGLIGKTLVSMSMMLFHHSCAAQLKELSRACGLLPVRRLLKQAVELLGGEHGKERQAIDDSMCRATYQLKLIAGPICEE